MASEHILVCLSPAPSNANIVCTGAQMAEAFGGAFTALYVQTSRAAQMQAEDRKRLQSHMRLAEKLGAGLTTVAGEDVAAEIVEYARISKVTKVVIGRSGSGGLLWGKLPLTERLIQMAPQLDIYIIPDIAGENGGLRNPIEDALAKPDVRQWLVLLLWLGAATALNGLFAHGGFPQGVMMLTYILAVLLTALQSRSQVCSAFSALAGVLLHHLLFTGHRFSLAAEDARSFLAMLAVSLATGVLAAQLAERSWQNAQTASRTQILFETNQLLQSAQSEADVLTLAARQLEKLLNRALVVYSLGWEKMTFGFEGEEEPAREALGSLRRCGASTGLFPECRGLYLPIGNVDDSWGVVGIDMEKGPLEPFEDSILQSLLGECALTLEGLRNAREKEAAAIRAENEQLRANLLRSISHDLRTPLTSISGNAENLMEGNETLPPAERLAVLKDIHADAEWLHRLVENLLSITRIAEGRLTLNLTPQLAEEVIAEALPPIQRMADFHTIKTQLPEELLLARMDPRLIIQVLVNLAENAVKYAPEGTEITISAQKAGSFVAFTVADQGPGIPEGQKEQIFEMFYTGKTGAADARRSLGLGLALCRSIVNAHGGQITVADNQPRGSRFTFTIPECEVTLHE